MGGDYPVLQKNSLPGFEFKEYIYRKLMKTISWIFCINIRV